MFDTRGATELFTLVAVFAAALSGRPAVVAPAGAAYPANLLDARELPARTWLAAATSGTSGRPRVITRTAASWTSSFPALTRLAALTAADTVLLTGPLTSTLHLFGAVHTLSLGATLTNRTDRATAVHAVPAVLADLLDQLGTRAPLARAVVAGSALPDELADRARGHGIAVLEYYGAAELSFVAARRPPARFTAFPGVQCAIRDGVIWARSPFLCTGYAPSGVTGPFRRDAENFATVGDLGSWEADGGLRVHGRGDAAITTGGATVIAEDVESAVARITGVRAVAVVGRPHPRLGEVVTAVVELDSGTDLAFVRRAARAVLTGPALPRSFVVRAALPRTPAGKLDRAAVAIELRAGQAGRP